MYTTAKPRCPCYSLLSCSQCQSLMHGKQWFPIEVEMIGTTLHQPQEDEELEMDEYRVGPGMDFILRIESLKGSWAE